MSTILADIALSPSTARDGVKSQRLPRALGLGLAALVTGAMWVGVIVALRVLF